MIWASLLAATIKRAIAHAAERACGIPLSTQRTACSARHFLDAILEAILESAGQLLNEIRSAFAFLAENAPRAHPKRDQASGRGPRRPVNLCLDKGYDYDDCEREVRQRGIVPHVRRRGEPPLIGCTHGRPRRWVVERANSWHNNYRALRIRSDRKASHYLAMLHMASALIAYRAARRRRAHRF